MKSLIEKFEENDYSDLLIIDGHMHLGKPYNFFSSGYTAGSLIKSMDLNGIKLGCISSLHSIGQYAVKGNLEIENLVSRYPDRFIGQFGVNPNYPEELNSILQDVKDKKCFKQIKIHPYLHNYPINGEQYHKLYAFGCENNYSLLSHTWGIKDIRDFDGIADQYPDLKIILGHSGGEIDAILVAADVAQKRKNVFLDITISFNYQGLIEWLVSNVPVEKLFFGSDATYNSQSAALGKVIYADISDYAKTCILGLNMKKLLGI